ELGDLEIGIGRVLLAAALRVEVADLEPDPDVLRVLLDDLEVLLDRLVDLTLLDRLPGGVHHLILIDGQRSLLRARSVRLIPLRGAQPPTATGGCKGYHALTRAYGFHPWGSSKRGHSA